MSDQTPTTNDDFSGGFLVKNAQGEFKKIKGDSDFDLGESDKSDRLTSFKKSSPTPQPVYTPKPPTTPAVSPPQHIQQQSRVEPADESDDEEDIQKHAAELKKMIAQPRSDAPATIDAIVQKIISQQGLQFTDEIMQKRFSKVLESRLREIRSSIEVADVLQRQKKIGGLELPKEQVEKIITSLNVEAAIFLQKESSTPTPSKVSIPPVVAQEEEHKEKKSDLFTDAPPAFVPRPGGAAPEKALTDDTPDELAKQIQKELQAMKPKESPSPPSEPEHKEPEHKIEIEVPSEEPQKPEINPKPVTADHELYGQVTGEMPRMRQAPSVDSSRATVIDIRQPTTMVGPVEEIHQIDLKEFRRLGSNPEESSEKISEKIDLLEEESWQMRMDGLNAWRQSPLFSLYLEIGQASIESGIGVQEIINTRKEKNEPHLLMEEFVTLNELNSSLTI